jgi:hypothetical protein
MLRLTDAFALLGICVVLCAGLIGMLTAWRAADARATWVKVLAALCFVLLWVPVGATNIPVVAYARGITGDLSVTLVMLAVWRVGRLALKGRAIAQREQIALMAAVAVAALFLYPLALGWGDWDAYRPGWGSWGMLLALLVLCAVCGAANLQVLPALVATALLAWSLGLLESGNLWDYLLDPWLSIYALAYVVHKVAHKVFIKCAQAVMARFR